MNWVREAGAESCIASHELARSVEQALGPVFVAPSDAELAIEARVRHVERGAGWAARIVVSDRLGRVLGERELASKVPDCRALDPQILLVIVLAIDPEVALEHLPVELLQPLQTTGDPAAELLAELRAEARARGLAPTAAASEHPPPARHDSTAPRPTAEPPRPRADTREEPHVTLSAGLAGGLGALPKPSAGPSLGLGLSLPRPWSVGLTLIWWPANDAALAAPTSRGNVVHFQMALGALSLCATLLRLHASEWRGCGGLAAGVLWTDASALTQPANVTRGNIGPTLSTEVAVPLVSRLLALLTVAAELPLLRERFSYRDPRGAERELFSPARIALWARLALGVMF
ncbi:MAG: hypothetical protein ACHQ53_06225 [Polyangiales bacterium]